jgi:hypothetical protein
MKPALISRFPPKNKKSFKIEEGVEASLPEVRLTLINFLIVRFSEWFSDHRGSRVT